MMDSTSKKCTIHDVDYERDFGQFILLSIIYSLMIAGLVHVFGGTWIHFIFFTLPLSAICSVLSYWASYDCPECVKSTAIREGLKAKKTETLKKAKKTETLKCKWCGRRFKKESLASRATTATMAGTVFAPITMGLSLLAIPFIVEDGTQCPYSDCPRPRSLE